MDFELGLAGSGFAVLAGSRRWPPAHELVERRIQIERAHVAEDPDHDQPGHRGRRGDRRRCGLGRCEAADHEGERYEQGQPDEVLHDPRHHRLHEAKRSWLLGDELREWRGDECCGDRNQRVVGDPEHIETERRPRSCEREICCRTDHHLGDEEQRDQHEIGAFGPGNERFVDAPRARRGAAFGRRTALGSGLRFRVRLLAVGAVLLLDLGGLLGERDLRARRPFDGIGAPAWTFPGWVRPWHQTSTYCSSIFSTAMNASWGISTLPTRFMRRLPSRCFSSSLRFRVMSPP